MPTDQNDNQHTARLVQFLAASTWDDIPATVRHEARRSLINYFAVALGACNDATIAKAIQVMRPFGSTFGSTTHSGASLIGRNERFDMLHAAAINAMAANVYDFDDTHIPTIVHPTAPVAAALLALAQTRPIAGDAFLLAFVVGVEMECRIANAVSPSHYARGWHITSTCGVFGAAAAAAKCLGLSAQQMIWAFGNAAAQSSGLVETLGTSAKSISIGNAARNGLLAALLAQADFEGPAAPLDGTYGWLGLVCDAVDWCALAGETPARWQLQRNTYKPYPCGVVLNPVIDACLAVINHPEFIARGVDAIARIEVTGHPLLRQRTDRPDIANGRQSQVSAQHAVGVVMTRRRAGLAEFSDDAVADSRVRALGARLRFIDDASLPVEAARLRVTFTDSTRIDIVIDAARGSLDNPLSDAELETKLRELCRYGQSGVEPQPLIDTVWSLAQCTDVGDVMKLVEPKHA